MNEGTERLAKIVEDIEELTADAMAGTVHLKEAGRIGCYGVMLRAILKGQRDRDCRIAAQGCGKECSNRVPTIEVKPIKRLSIREAANRPRGGLDFSQPTGDRDF